MDEAYGTYAADDDHDDDDDDDHDYDVLDDLYAKLRIGGETTRQGWGGVNPPQGLEEIGLEWYGVAQGSYLHALRPKASADYGKRA